MRTAIPPLLALALACGPRPSPQAPVAAEPERAAAAATAASATVDDAPCASDADCTTSLRAFGGPCCSATCAERIVTRSRAEAIERDYRARCASVSIDSCPVFDCAPPLPVRPVCRAARCVNSATRGHDDPPPPAPSDTRAPEPIGGAPALGAQGRAPAFEVIALGVLGGDDPANLSSYLLARPGDTPSLLIDGGSPAEGIVRWRQKEGRLDAAASPDQRMAAVIEVLRPLHALLLTHSHLDHWAGFALGNPVDVDLADAGRPTVEIIALPDTIEALRAHLYRAPLWADFTSFPKTNPTLRLAALAPGARRAVGPFEVETIPLVHPVPSAAFLVRAGDDAYLHLGDTSATTAVWTAARPLLANKQLRAVAVEVSFPSEREPLARATGHLTPRSLLGELSKLAGLPAPADNLAEADARALAARLAPALAGCTIVAIHIKAHGYERVVAELRAYQRAGLPLLIPEQGARYRF